MNYYFMDEYLNLIDEIEFTIRAAYTLPAGGKFVIINTINYLWDTIPALVFEIAYIRDKQRLSCQEWEVINIYDAVAYPFDDDHRITVGEIASD